MTKLLLGIAIDCIGTTIVAAGKRPALFVSVLKKIEMESLTKQGL